MTNSNQKTLQQTELPKTKSLADKVDGNPAARQAVKAALLAMQKKHAKK